MRKATQEDERNIAASLIARVRGNDPRARTQAETDIVNRYHRGLKYLLRRKTHDIELADDLMQETWVVAFQKIRSGNINDPGKLAGYLYGIAKNMAQGEFNKSRRRKTSADSDYVALVPDDAPSVYEKISRAETCDYVRQLLDEQTVNRDREILHRFYIQDEEKSRICNDLKIDSIHFNRVLFRAKKRFKNIVLRAQLRDKLYIVEN